MGPPTQAIAEIWADRTISQPMPMSHLVRRPRGRGDWASSSPDSLSGVSGRGAADETDTAAAAAAAMPCQARPGKLARQRGEGKGLPQASCGCGGSANHRGALVEKECLNTQTQTHTHIHKHTRIHTPHTCHVYQLLASTSSLCLSVCLSV